MYLAFHLPTGGFNAINMIKRCGFLLGCFLLASCGGEDVERVKVMVERHDLPVETGKNIIINYTDSGYVKSKVFAPVLQRYASVDKYETVMPAGITAYFLDKTEKVESFLKSKYAVRYDKERRMVAKNDVILVNIKGDTLRTELLNWDEQTQRIHTDQFIRITTPTQIIMGDGLESNTEFTQYKIFKIRGTINLVD